MTKRSILYIDSAYTLTMMRTRKHEHYMLSRHRGGYFSKVFSVHPLAGLHGSQKAGQLIVEQISDDHVVLDGFEEGKSIPKWRIPFNVLGAQVRLLGKMRRIVKRDNVDVVFATDCFYSGLLGLAVTAFTSKPLIVGIYCNQDEAFEATGQLAYPRLLPHRKLEQWIQRLVLRYADWIEVPADNTARHVTSYGADPKKFLRLPVVKFIGRHHYTNPAARPFPAKLLESLSVPLGRNYLLYVGRLSPVKYPGDVIEAMKLAIEEVPGTIGLLAGDGPLRPELEALIIRYGLEGKVFLLGNLDQQVLAMLIAHCIILSPLTGMALIETSLAGAPVVAYDREWHPEFITDGDNGFLVPFRDIRTMASQAVRLLRDVDLRCRIGTRAREKALKFADQESHRVKEWAAMNMVLSKMTNFQAASIEKEA